MDVHVERARNDKPVPGIDDLRTWGGRRQSRANRRDRLAANRHVGLRFPLGAYDNTIGDHNIISHGQIPFIMCLVEANQRGAARSARKKLMVNEPASCYKSVAREREQTASHTAGAVLFSTLVQSGSVVRPDPAGRPQSGATARSIS